jgi:predicted transcriptional regulator
VESVGAALGAKRLASGIDDSWKSAVEGRGMELVVEEGYRQPAILHREGYVLELVDDESATDGPRHLDDAVDELVELVLEKGGEVTFVDDGALADCDRVALILRY